MSASQEDHPRTDSQGEAREPPVRRRRDTIQRVLRWLAGMAALLGIVIALARWFRPELEAVGRAFVERFGYPGMALGTFIADGFHFPVPPQFYMLMAITTQSSPLLTLAWITAGSLLGGTAGYALARRLSHVRFVARWMERSSKVIERYGSLQGYKMVIALSLTPVAYSVLCYLAGVYRLPKRSFAVLSAFRIPKILLYYYLVRVGWNI